MSGADRRPSRKKRIRPWRARLYLLVLTCTHVLWRVRPM